MLLCTAGSTARLLFTMKAGTCEIISVASESLRVLRFFHRKNYNWFMLLVTADKRNWYGKKRTLLSSKKPLHAIFVCLFVFRTKHVMSKTVLKGLYRVQPYLQCVVHILFVHYHTQQSITYDLCDRTAHNQQVKLSFHLWFHKLDNLRVLTHENEKWNLVPIFCFTFWDLYYIHIYPDHSRWQTLPSLCRQLTISIVLPLSADS